MFLPRPSTLSSTAMVALALCACVAREGASETAVPSAVVPDSSVLLLSGRLSNEAGREGGDTTFVTCGEQQTAAGLSALVHEQYQGAFDAPGNRCVLWLARATYPSSPVSLKVDSLRFAGDTAIAFATYDTELARQDRSMRPVVAVSVVRPVSAVRSVVSVPRTQAAP